MPVETIIQKMREIIAEKICIGFSIPFDRIVWLGNS
jgi:hypothetical protein